jgi:hypothetical protein
MAVLVLALVLAVLAVPASADVSHAGWPEITGEHLTAARGDDLTGTVLNDEILGGHGNDRISGMGGNDVLWGDKNPTNNNTWQHDTLSGGPGSDWIYPSHGTNIVDAGPGSDHVKAYYGHGSIDCGPGYDIAQVRMNNAYTLHNCEHIVHFCQYGSTPDGTCKKPGEAVIIGRR